MGRIIGYSFRHLKVKDRRKKTTRMYVAIGLQWGKMYRRDHRESESYDNEYICIHVYVSIDFTEASKYRSSFIHFAPYLEYVFFFRVSER